MISKTSSLKLNKRSEIVWRVDRVTEELTKIWSETTKKQAFNVDTIVKMIDWAWRNNEVIDITIEGKKGSGKTTLALMISAYVYGRRGHPAWKKALDSLYFKPTELLLDLIKRVTAGDKIKAVILDDAGAWLSKWTITSEKEAFFEAFELSRTLVGSMIFTNVASLAKYIRMTASLRIRVRRLKYSERVELAQYVADDIIRESLYDRAMRWSEARVYSVHFDLDYKERLRKEAVFVFPVRLPDKIYKLYIEKRHQYTGLKMVMALVRLAKAQPVLLPEILAQAEQMGVLDYIIVQMCNDRYLKKHLQTLDVDCDNGMRIGEIES